jgi:hypothetical protein
MHRRKDVGQAIQGAEKLLSANDETMRCNETAVITA